MSVAEIKQELTRPSSAERIELMNATWDSLDAQDQEMHSPEWHAEILSKRAAKINSGEAKFLSIEGLKERLTSASLTN